MYNATLKILRDWSSELENKPKPSLTGFETNSEQLPSLKVLPDLTARELA